MRKKPKYKEGDEVIILPNAVKIGIIQRDVGKTATIIDVNTCYKHTTYRVLLKNNRRWNVYEPYIASAKKNKQLFFDFMLS